MAEAGGPDIDLSQQKCVQGGPGFRTDALDTEDREAWRPEGVLEREDSASYQRRPPALAERQDSASNLQVCQPLHCHGTKRYKGRADAHSTQDPL